MKIDPHRRQSGMTPNGSRVREALVHVIREGDSRDMELSQFDITKTLFLADREHLNKYGRPITFDEYIAMNDGPVPSLAYDVLKDAIGGQREAGIDKPLWKSVFVTDKKTRFFEAVRDASDDVLSETDKEALTSALVQVKSWGYQRTWDHVHNDPAYINAWAKRGDAQSHYMEYSDLLDEPDDEYANELKFLSAHL